MKPVVFLVFSLLVVASTASMAEDDIRQEQVKFQPGKTSASIKGHLKGRETVDYQLRASAGQTMDVTLKASNRFTYFNVYAPESDGTAMFAEGAGDKAFKGLLPSDGTYVIRVYLIRAAARRNEAGSYALSLSVDGAPLKPVSGKVDAMLPGTPYHAQSSIPCKPAYSEVAKCEASVIRRSSDGSATVDIRWGSGTKRSILFVHGKPAAADTFQEMSYKKNGDITIVQFGGEERFEIPDALIHGG
jgi:hypothetical protein